MSPEEAATLQETVSAIKEGQIAKTLEELAERELGLLANPRIGGDPEMRQVTIWHAAALIAAAERLSPTPK